MPKLKIGAEMRWKEKGAGENFLLLCELIKENAISTKKLSFESEKPPQQQRRVFLKKV